MEAEGEGEAEVALSEFWTITAHVHGKTFSISVGDASQRVKWLGHVAIARWDEDKQQGWLRLGIPTFVRAGKKDGVELDMSSIIKDVLQNGDSVYVSTSLQPSDTRV
jgi:hypothetical protein